MEGSYNAAVAMFNGPASDDLMLVEIPFLE
jgi:hypothetical protein